jgi:CubicO group peptidase (beta-lactamase class C family)
MDSPLPRLPSQPEGTPWPTTEWPRHPDDSQRQRVDELLDQHFTEAAKANMGKTYALVVVQGGRLVAERYGGGMDSTSRLRSWSMAKSILHALVGILVRDGKLDIHSPAPVPAWQAPGDPRREITLDQLLRMSSGLAFQEVYEPDIPSDVIAMLFGTGKRDVARFAEGSSLARAPDTYWSYSSGTSNIVSGIVHRSLGMLGDEHKAYLFSVLFDRLGMTSALPQYDEAGTWIASSFCNATARDFARFGLFCLRDGVWEGDRILPEGWIDYGRTVTPASSGWYGAHFWRALDGSDRFTCNGFRCQYIVMDPARDLVVVRSGDSEEDQRAAVLLALAELVEAQPLLS